MPTEAIAQYGIATFALAGVFYFVSQVLRDRRNGSSKDKLIAVVENNTKATEQLIGVMTSFREIMVQTMARQDQKLDELLARARRE